MYKNYDEENVDKTMDETIDETIDEAIATKTTDNIESEESKDEGFADETLDKIELIASDEKTEDDSFDNVEEDGSFDDAEEDYDESYEEAKEVYADEAEYIAQHEMEEMTELTSNDNTRYTDDEIEAMDSVRMAHVIMNDDSRTDMALLSEVFGDDAYTNRKKKKEAKRTAKMEKRIANGDTPLARFLGISSIVLAVLGAALIGVAVYFLIVSPTYNKSEYLNKEFKYNDSATLTDADYTMIKEGYYIPEIATGDAVMEGGDQNE